MNKVKKLLGDQIRAIRKTRGLTQEQLAELVDIDQKHVSCIELGKNAPPIDRLEKIAQALEVPIRSFFEFDGCRNDDKNAAEIALMLDELDSNKRQLAYALFKSVVQALQKNCP